MRDYEQTIRELRDPQYVYHYSRDYLKNMMDDAADAIEELLPSAQTEQQWISFKTRPMDEDERKEWSEKLGYNLEHEDAVIYTGQLPDDGQEVIVCSKYGHIWIDTFEIDPDYGVGFEENGDMDGLVAWMPLPDPYEEHTMEEFMQGQNPGDPEDGRL